MQVQKTYRFKDEESRESFINSATQNIKYVDVLSGEFIVIETRQSGSVTKVGVKNENGQVRVHDTYSLRGEMNGVIISFDSEFHLFEEVGENDYGCLVCSPEVPGYLIREKNKSYDDAVAYGEMWLKNHPDDTVIVFKGIDRMTTRKEPKVVSVKFK
ncbi:conserved hypothetical protein [Edwardsiella phage PEi26]|uniref:Uncharacterized protein n=1 Tax=Edwardsiella phage PEi26 TaxID=1608311 RepID=A0A0B6VLP5_9CAUD|nr:conserved hypothetical protein [Edwardsiella phage PEi26]